MRGGWTGAISWGVWLLRFGVSLLLLLALGCGPCVGIRADYDAHLREGLATVALGDRIALTSREHARLVFGAEAFGAASASVLRERSSQGVSNVVMIPAAPDTRGGAVTVDFELRLERVSTLSLLDPGSEDDVGVQASLQAHARFEIPGQRSRWSWTSSFLLRAPLVIDDDPRQVAIAVGDAELVELEPNFPWDASAMPASVAHALERALNDVVDAWLARMSDTMVPVARVAALDLPRITIPVQVLSVRVDEVSGAVSLSLVSALRPSLDDVTRPRLTQASEHEVIVSIPLPTLDAALLQQVLQTGGSRIVQGEDGSYWQPLWEPDARRPDRWQGAWRLWCLDNPKCARRELPVSIRSEVVDRRLRLQVDSSELVGDMPPETAQWETMASLQDLNRRTIEAMVRQIAQWGRSATSESGLAIEPVASEVSGRGLYVRFLAR